MILHTVLFQPKPDLSAENRRAFVEALGRASTEISTVRRARVGRQTEIGVNYRQPGDKTYEYVAVLEFDSVDDLRSYLNHPLHRELGRQFWLACESTMIHDSTAVDVTDDVEQLLEGKAFVPLREDPALEKEPSNDVAQRGNRLGGVDRDAEL